MLWSAIDLFLYFFVCKASQIPASKRAVCQTDKNASHGKMMGPVNNFNLNPAVFIFYLL